MRTYHLTLIATTLAVLAAISLYLRANPRSYLGAEYPMWEAAFETARDPAAPAADLLIVGDSRAKAGLLPKVFGQNAYSLTLGGAEPATLHHLLSEYLRAHRAPRTLILSIAPYHFSKAEAFWERGGKFGLLDWEATQSILSEGIALGDPVLGDSTLELRGLSFLYAARAPHLYFGELWNARVAGRTRSNERVRANVRASRGHYFFGTAAGSSGKCWETQFEHLSVSPLLDRYVRRILDLSVKSGARTHFAIMPMNSASVRALKPAFRRELEAHLAKLARAYPAVAVDTTITELPDRYFGDESHLNEEGARLTSEGLANRVASRASPAEATTEEAPRDVKGEQSLSVELQPPIRTR